jgi:NAD(P)H-dependent flavin oxidoreductase YrpB (nitropropane dioxygenase family)
VAYDREHAAGRTDDMVILAGQVSGLIRKVLPAGEVVRRVVAEAIARGLPGVLEEPRRRPVG